MNKLIKIPFSAVQKVTVVLLCVLWMLFSCSCQSKMENSGENIDDPTELIGTKWELVGVVDAQTGALKVLEPKDCDKCYTISFIEDSVFNESTWFNGRVDVEPGWYKLFAGRSPSNFLSVWYRHDNEKYSFEIYNIGGTLVAENWDEPLFRNCLIAVQSFSLNKNELKLYYNENKNYLLFKPLKL